MGALFGGSSIPAPPSPPPPPPAPPSVAGAGAATAGLAAQQQLAAAAGSGVDQTLLTGANQAAPPTARGKTLTGQTIMMLALSSSLLLGQLVLC